MKQILFLFILLVFISSCDRFEHELFKSAEIEAALGEFFSDLETITADSLEVVLDWYSEDYLNDKQDKYDIENTYENYFLEYGDDLILSGELVEYWNSKRLIWDLLGILPDSTFIISQNEDYLIMEDGGYRFYGNQEAPPALDESKPVVLVEFFTSTFCTNCPSASMKLEEMLAEYGEQMILIEYVQDKDPAMLYSPESGYYGAFQPGVVFQGEFLINGAGENSLAEYDMRYTQAVEEFLEFRFTDIEMTLSGMEVNLEVSWEFLTEINIANLQLRAVLLEENPDFHYNASPSVHFENRIIAGRDVPFDESRSGATITIDLVEALPADYSAVVWLQCKPEEWTAGEAKVYNAIKVRG